MSNFIIIAKKTHLQFQFFFEFIAVTILSLDLLINFMMVMLDYYDVKIIKKAEANCNIASCFSCNISNYSSLEFTIIAQHYFIINFGIRSSNYIIMLITITIIIRNNCCIILHNNWDCLHYPTHYEILVIYKLYYNIAWQLMS